MGRLETRLRTTDNNALRFFMRCLLPLQQQFVRETFIKLRETQFRTVPAQFFVDLQGFRDAWRSTLAIKEMFNEGRQVADVNRAKKLDPEAL